MKTTSKGLVLQLNHSVSHVTRPSDGTDVLDSCGESAGFIEYYEDLSYRLIHLAVVELGHIDAPVKSTLSRN